VKVFVAMPHCEEDVTSTFDPFSLLKVQHTAFRATDVHVKMAWSGVCRFEMRSDVTHRGKFLEVVRAFPHCVYIV